MSDFNPNDYFRILIRSIRKGVAVPFDCYLFLQANNRIIRYVANGSEFPEEKLAKLTQHAFTDLYIRKEEIPAYQAYLREFLSSPEGAEAVRELAEQGEEAVVGIPAAVAEEFKELLAPLSLAEAQPAEGVSRPAPPESARVDEARAAGQPLADGLPEELREFAVDETPGAEATGGAVQEEAESGPEPHAAAREEVPPEGADLRGLILDVLKTQVRGLEEKFSAAPAAAPGEESDDLALIREVTARIQDEMSRVRGRGDGPPDETVIREVTENVTLEIQRIRGVAESAEGERAERLKRHATGLERHLKALAKLRNSNAPDHLRVKQADAAVEAINTEVWEIKRLYRIEDAESIDETDAVSEALSGMIEGLEEVLGVQLQVAPPESAMPEMAPVADAAAKRYLGLLQEILYAATEFSGVIGKVPDPGHVIQPRYGELFEKIQELHRQCASDADAADAAEESSGGRARADGEGAEAGEARDAGDGGDSAGPGGGGGASGETVPAEIAKRLAALVTDQERVIIDLSNRLKTAKSIYGDILRKWDQIQAKARNKLDSNELKLAQSLSDDFRAFGTLYLGANAASLNLKDLTDRLADVVGAQKEDLQAGDEDERAGVAPEGEDGAGEAAAAGIRSAADLKVPDGPREGATDDEIRSEYKLLLVQLQNAKALLESNEKKIAELARALNQTSSYAESLEKEMGEKSAELDRFRDKSEELSSKINRMMEVMDSADRNLLMAREEIRAKDEVIRGLNDKVLALDKELRQYRAVFKDVEGKSLVDTALLDKMEIPDELKAHIKDMETHLRRYEGELESKRGEIRELRKEIVKLNGKVQDNTLLKQQLAQKLDKIKLDVETSRRAEQAMNRKIVMVTNLLDESRKTISKLTSVNEELRRDRMEYMARTNQALRDYKDMMNKANSLDRHVQAEIQRNQTLGEQNEILKDKQKELATRLADMQKENLAMEAEIKRLRRAMESAAGGAAVIGSGENNPLVLQRRIEELEKEKKTLAKWLTEERKKVSDMAQLLKRRSGAA